MLGTIITWSIDIDLVGHYEWHNLKPLKNSHAPECLYMYPCFSTPTNYEKKLWLIESWFKVISTFICHEPRILEKWMQSSMHLAWCDVRYGETILQESTTRRKEWKGKGLNT